MSPIYRPIEKLDLQNLARVFVASLNHRNIEAGIEPLVDLDDTEAWNTMWETERRPLFEHVSAHSGAGWLAEDDSGLVGYARSIQREGVCQLTELFVLPENQNTGVGQELLSRAFDQVESPSRLIMANSNPAAISRYMRAGVYPVCATFDLERKAREVPFETDLEVKPMLPGPDLVEAISRIDKTLLGYTRPEEHKWLGEQRDGSLFCRNGAVIGYAYAGRWSGPMAALDREDMPAILAHTETAIAKSGATFTVMVPIPNRSAMMHLIGNGFKLDSDQTMYFMGDFSPPGLDRYIFSMPGFFV